MINKIKNAVVLGSSGTIGNLIGGLLAQKGIKIYFLSRTLKGAKYGLQKAIAQARSEVISRYIECGDYEHSLKSALELADLIIESVTEDLEAKQQIYKMVERYRKTDTIIGTTTSSLPLKDLAEDRSESFRKNFLSMHFYNPPGKMLACEISVNEDTDPKVYDFVKGFLKKELGRVVIPVNNIPGFAGNRIAFMLFNRISLLAKEYGVELMDYLIGPYTGRLMSPLATIDLVGLDIHRAIIRSLRKNTKDRMHDSFVMPDYISKMIDNGFLGNKAKGGFYKKLENGKLVFIDPLTCDYIPAIQPHIAFVETAKSLIHLGRYREAFDVIRTSHTKEAEIVLDIICMYVAHSYSLIGEVTKPEFGIDGIDNVMSSGFNWAAPSVIVNMFRNKEELLKLLADRNLEVPEALIAEKESPEKVINCGKYFIAR